jgi:hypothetical protein
VPKGKYAGLYIEMKYGNGQIQKTQREFLKEAMKYGHYSVVCYESEAAIEIIREYIDLKPIDAGRGENEMKIPNGSILKEGKVKPL